MGIFDRRAVERVRCVLEVDEMNGESCPGTYLIDISPLGAQLETAYPLGTGDSVEIGLSLPIEKLEEDEVYRLVGRVVWIKNSNPAPNRYRIGLSFLTPFSDTTKILAEFRYKFV